MHCYQHLFGWTITKKMYLHNNCALSVDIGWYSITNISWWLRLRCPIVNSKLCQTINIICTVNYTITNLIHQTPIRCALRWEWDWRRTSSPASSCPECTSAVSFWSSSVGFLSGSMAIECLNAFFWESLSLQYWQSIKLELVRFYSKNWWKY